MTRLRLPTYFLSHGAGPWSFMEGEFRLRFQTLEHALGQIGKELEDVESILVVSAHWEERGFAISSGASPGMIYDYYGFPPYTYNVHYKAPGSPALAHRVQQLLESGGIKPRLDPNRGYDHGTFGMMKPLRPKADKPIVQLSLHRNLDPELHFAVGRMLMPLRDEGAAILGSGQSFQNLGLRDARAIEPSAAFDAWLQQTVVHSSPDERHKKLMNWEDAPYARVAHAREEHLIPLMVAAGAAGEDAAECIYHEQLWGFMTAASFRFGRPQRAH